MLRWVDPADGATAHSPILLCPVQLKRTGAQSPYTVERTDDEAVVNPALRLHLERDFSLQLPGVDEFTPDLDKLLLQVADLITGTRRMVGRAADRPDDVLASTRRPSTATSRTTSRR